MVYTCRMKHIPFLFLVFFLTTAPGYLPAQEQLSLSYFLPSGSYDPKVPTPAQFLGEELGSRHLSHDQLLAYMRQLASTSPRIQLQEYGRSHENRPLVCLRIAGPTLQPQLEALKARRRALIEGNTSAPADLERMPGVLYMGYSIHGNEASGCHAAVAVAYWLAAAQGPAIDALLENNVVLLDPCFNPDGLQRFSSWVNSRRSQTSRTDPADDEFNEHWPGGRYNHYWFDLNRDWLVMQQPESEGRVRLFQEWLPNILTDHHEMGSNSTFFFQPGVPTRVNPITPARNQELTAEIARFHANALSEKGILFYSGENFDDFYYGKGSTYPDANGSIGILFEQASSRGSAQETSNGILTFAYSIRNQVITSFSSLKALETKRTELNQYLLDFYQTARKEAEKNPVKGYLIQAKGKDASHLHEFERILTIHRIQFHPLSENTRVQDLEFHKESAIVVPTNQTQYRLIRGIFERPTQFRDSLFYDISAWTLPDAFGLQWAPQHGMLPRHAGAEQRQHGAATYQHGTDTAGTDTYGYMIPADAAGLPALLVQLLKKGYRVKTATQTFEIAGQTFQPGSLFIASDRQPGDLNRLPALLESATPHYLAVEEGSSDSGPWLGSNHFVNCSLPKVLIATGEGINPLDAGEIWHYLDTRLGLACTLVEKDRLANLALSKYQVVILPDGNYKELSADKLKEFVQNGGTLIATGKTIQWLKTAGISNAEARQLPAVPNRKNTPFNRRSEAGAARNMPGAIFAATLDTTHPIGYGMPADLSVFLPEALFLEPTDQPAQTPMRLSSQPLLAGYLHPSLQATCSGAAPLLLQPMGSGRVIQFAMNPNFRGFWRGTERLMGNAVLFGPLIRN